MKRWYVVQVSAGYENTVKAELEKFIRDDGVSEQFGQILVPVTKEKASLGVVEEKDKQLFPGYILVEMEMEPKLQRLVTSVNRVLKFLGGRNPIPLGKSEIDRVLGQVKGEIEVAAKKSEFVQGCEVEISDGPFTGFMGVVDAIDDENERLTVMVSIFGRMTPVEIGFDQIKH